LHLFEHEKRPKVVVDRCDCLSKGRVNKAVVVGNHYPALLRARRRRERWSAEDLRLYQRHRWRSEGFRGEAKTWHGLARAVRRGLANMKIQAYLTAAAINLKRLAAACSCIFGAMDDPPEPDTGATVLKNKTTVPFGRNTNSCWLRANRGKLIQRPPGSLHAGKEPCCLNSVGHQSSGCARNLDPAAPQVHPVERIKMEQRQ
jgi:hypothetical protein